MKKKYINKIKELEERVEALSTELKNMKAVNEFVKTFGEDGAYISETYGISRRIYYVCNYVSNGEIQSVVTNLSIEYCPRIIKTNKEEIILETIDNEYYKIEKETGICMEIPRPYFV